MIMRSLVAVFCVGAIFVAVFSPGVVALYATLAPLCDMTVGFDTSGPQEIVQSPSVSPALLALVVSHHLPRACLLAVHS
jgi:hypothetical protein